LRGDHDCFWVGGWIGIGNHRYFARGIMTASLFAIHCLVMTAKAFFTGGLHCPLVVWLAYTGITAGLGFMVGMQSIQQIQNLCANLTTVEILAARQGSYTNNYNRGCLRNCSEVCGDPRYLPCWLLPCPNPMIEDGFGYGETRAAPFIYI
jgi:hypothetical protein